MQSKFKNIFLSWRKGFGYRRHIIGLIKRNSQGVTFRYLDRYLEVAKGDGFSLYTEFQDTSKEYTENVLEIFSKRLINDNRNQNYSLYDFWEVPKELISDKFYLLGYTQGLLPTDNFEFLADYFPIKNLIFVSDLAGLSSSSFEVSELNIGEHLNYSLERDNEFDDYAVKVYHQEKTIGYIKKVHSRLFYSSKRKLVLTVKLIDNDINHKRVFIKIRMI